MLLVLYMISLVPLGSVVVSDKAVDLRKTINSLQSLQAAAVTPDPKLHRQMRESIKSMQALAGIHSFLVKEQHDNTDGSCVLITFKLRIPHLLPIEPEPQYPVTTWLQFSREVNDNYTSITSPPDTPPPNIT